jgi:membrane protein YqaA with SNARE-associated domain
MDFLSDIFNSTLIIDLFTEWQLWAVVISLTVLALVSSTAKYRLDKSGFESLKEHYPQVSDDRWDRVNGYFDRWGAPVVLFSFVPLLAWIIPPDVGAYGIRFRMFLLWASLAKMVRYWLLILIVFAIYRLLS